MASRRARGSGSVWQANDGRWRGRATINGATVSVSAPTQGEAFDRLTVERARLLTGEQSASKSDARTLTVAGWAAEWLGLCTARMEAGALKPSTVDGYTNLLALYVLPHLGPVKLAKLSPSHVHRWHAELLAHGGKDGRPVGPGTVAGGHRVLRAMLRDAQRQRKVQDNAASLAGGPGGVAPVQEFLSLVEVARVLAAFDGSRASAAVALGLLGLRRGEIAGLRWPDVDLDRGLVTVREALVSVAGRATRGTPKRRASYRTITMDDALLDPVRRWRSVQLEERMRAGPLWKDSGAVITTRNGTAMDPTNMARMMSRFVEEACGRAVSPHALRHTSASLMYEAGADLKSISEHLGHGDVGVTERVYTHLLSEARRRGGDALGRALRAVGDTPR